MTAALLIALVAATGNVAVEPDTGREFVREFEAEGLALSLTGADVRKVSGFAVYAIAHYGAGGTEVPATPADCLNYWIAAEAPKAFILRGTRRVPVRGIKWSWENSLDRVGYTGSNREAFIAAFTEGFDKKSEMLILAKPDGTLIVKQDGRLLDQWQDAALVRAVWEVSLGESSEVKSRENLVRVEHLKSAS